MKYDKDHFNTLHKTNGPELEDEHLKLAIETGLKFSSGIGELLFAANTCRPDIMYVVIKLSQFSQQPTKIHYQAVKHLQISQKNYRRRTIFLETKTRQRMRFYSISKYK